MLVIVFFLGLYWYVDRDVIKKVERFVEQKRAESDGVFVEAPTLTDRVCFRRFVIVEKGREFSKFKITHFPTEKLR